MIRLYERLTRHCATVNQLNRVHIAFENQMLPASLQALIQSAATGQGIWCDRWSAERQRWIMNLNHLFGQSGIAEPQSFSRHCVARGLVLYADKDIPASEKRLLVCFTGIARRLMIPTPIFLQHIDANATDVLLLRYPKPDGYRSGMPAIADGFLDLFKKLPRFFPPGDYKQKAVLGVSGGAIPATLLGISAKLDAALAFGIGSPDDERWRKVLKGGIAATINHLLPGQIPSARVTLVHGRDSEQDRIAANTWAAALPARIIAIGQKDASVGHACVHPLVFAGQLKLFLERELWSHP